MSFRDTGQGGGQGGDAGSYLKSWPGGSDEPQIERSQGAKELKKEFGPIIEGKRREMEPLLQRQQQMMQQPTPELHLERQQPPPNPEVGKNAMMWIAAATALGGLAGALTRRSSVNALTAFSGALDGFKQGDMDRAKMAYQQWDRESETVQRNNEAQWREYESILKRKDMDQRQMSDLIGITAQKWENQFVAQVADHAANTGNFEMLAAALDGGSGQIAKMEESRNRLRQAIEVAKIRATGGESVGMGPGDADIVKQIGEY